MVTTSGDPREKLEYVFNMYDKDNNRVSIDLNLINLINFESFFVLLLLLLLNTGD